MEMIKEPEFWVAVAFVLFIGVLVYVGAHKKVADALDHRSARIKAELDEARRLRDEAGKLLAEYQHKQREAESEAAAIIADARAEADTRRKALESQLNAKLGEAEKTIAATKTAAMSNVRGIAVDTATAIVERLIGTAPSGSAVEAAVADALKR